MTTDVAAGQQVADLSLQVTKIIDFGVTLDELLAGTPPPPAGARLDAHVAGTSTGLIAGTGEGVDYLNVRADGRYEIHVHGVLTTEDGGRIAIEAVGSGTLGGAGTFQFHQYVSLSTASAEYAWVNQLPLRSEGKLDLASGSLSIQYYAA